MVKLSHKQTLDYAWNSLQDSLLEKLYSPIHTYFQEKFKDITLKNNKLQPNQPGFTGFIYKNEKYDIQEFYPVYNPTRLLNFESALCASLALLDPSLEPELLKIKEELDSALEEYTKVKRAMTIIFTKLTDIGDLKNLLNMSFENLPLFDRNYYTDTPQPEVVNQLKIDLADELILIQSRLLDNILSD